MAEECCGSSNSSKYNKKVEVKLKKISDVEWEIPIGTVPNMKVPGRVFASAKLIEKMKQDRTLVQCAGVATLPGIYKYSIVLPDGHEGYGFPIGGVAALDAKEGGISPGGIGYDINCGVRLVRTNFKKEDIKEKIPELLDAIFKNVPSGVGSKGKFRLKSEKELDDVLKNGVKWAVKNGFGTEQDRKHIEEEGQLEADPSKVSSDAKKRGMPQLGSLGAGNHFLEIQYVDKIYDKKVAKVFGIGSEGQVTVMIHTGSRGFGHQVCSDYLRKMEKEYPEVIKTLPDRELIYAPAGSKMAKDYFSAMNCAANYAWTNRQMILHWTREAFENVFGKKWQELGMEIVYDVCHNIAKLEEHNIDGKIRKVYVHRKGATRAFGPGRKEIPADYREVGQPVIIPGSMGTASYVLVGSKTSMEKTFGSTAHGAGRSKSRHQALREYWGETVAKDLSKKGILIRAATKKVIAEEAPGAYKDIDDVAETSHKAGIGNLVVRLKPMGVVKG